jgi:hypothetical protein
MDIFSFVNILKYSNTEKKTPLENFTTELFVFLLNYLIFTKNRVIYEILNEFGFENTVKLEKIKISTQVITSLGIPDIIIEHLQNKTIIEVKIDSRLNNYEMDKNTINQLEKYTKIKGISKVYLLTKRVILIDNIRNKKIKGKIYWSKIYNILECSNDFVVKSFNCFLEENGMNTNRLDRNIYKALESLNTLSILIEQSWNYIEYPLSPFSYSKQGWFGCYVKSKKQNILWLGLTDNVLLFHFTDKKIEKKYKDDGNSFDEGSISQIFVKDIIDIKNPEKQKEYLTKWFINIMEKKLKKYLV